jgi:hypothetical protein
VSALASRPPSRRARRAPDARARRARRAREGRRAALVALALLPSALAARADVLPDRHGVSCPPGAAQDPHAARCVASLCEAECGPVATCEERRLCVSRPSRRSGAGHDVVAHAECRTQDDCGERGRCEALRVCVYPDDGRPRGAAGPGAARCDVAGAPGLPAPRRRALESLRSPR